MDIRKAIAEYMRENNLTTDEVTSFAHNIAYEESRKIEAEQRAKKAAEEAKAKIAAAAKEKREQEKKKEPAESVKPTENRKVYDFGEFGTATVEKRPNGSILYTYEYNGNSDIVTEMLDLFKPHFWF